MKIGCCIMEQLKTDNLVRPSGFEPLAFCSGDLRSSISC
jgi:hypothetical protein